MSPAEDCADLVRDLMFTANGAYGSYDSWKLRADLDEQPPEDERDWQEIESVCGTCGGCNGAHSAGCPDSPSLGGWVDAEIDRMKEDEP